MAVYGFNSTLANALTSGINLWMVKRASDVAYYSLGDLKDGKVSVQSLSETTTTRKMRAYGYKLDASAKMLCTEIGTLNKLDHLLDEQLAQKILFINGTSLAGNWGFSLKFDSTKDYEGVRFIEVKADIGQAFSGTNWNNFAGGSPPANGTPNANDALYAFAPTNMVIAGSTAFQIRNVGETAWETLGLYRDFKLVIEASAPKPDSQSRRYANGFNFTIEADMLQASQDELDLLEAVAQSQADFKATLADGVTFTFADIAGVAWEFRHDNDSEDFAVIHMKGTGFIPISSWAGIVA